MSKKIRLEIEALAVETFDATPREPVARGTVEARGGLTAIGCATQRCTPEAGSCGSSCDAFAPCGCGVVTAGATCLPHNC